VSIPAGLIHTMNSLCALILLIPVGMAIFFWLTTAVCVAVFLRGRRFSSEGRGEDGVSPPVSLMKPVCGVEKGLFSNLSTACGQAYRDYEVLYGLQRGDDPALSVLEKIRAAHPHCKIRIVVDETDVGPNGKVSNLQNLALRAKGEVLVISDSDMFLAPDYLEKIVAPLADPRVGICCTLYRAWRPGNLWEALALLSYNLDFVPSMVFAVVTKSSLACPGATLAMRREVLDEIGGLPPLADYLVEDYELGRRVAQRGYRIHFIPYVAAMGVDLDACRAWWDQQISWDQKTKSANPAGFFSTLLIRGIPFALMYGLAGGPWWGTVLLATTGIRLVTAASNAQLLGDSDGLRRIWLLPLRDLLALLIWVAALFKRRTCWKEKAFVLKKGRLEAVK
jgi:ceramide glucosyltransferase